MKRTTPNIQHRTPNIERRTHEIGKSLTQRRKGAKMAGLLAWRLGVSLLWVGSAAADTWTNSPAPTPGTNAPGPVPNTYISHLTNTNDPHHTLMTVSNMTGVYYSLAFGNSASGLAVKASSTAETALANAASAAAANVATSNSIAVAVTAGTSGLSVVYYPLDWGNIVSNLAAAGGGSVTLGDVTNTITALVPPLIAGGTTLAATTATYAASAGYATNAGEAAHAMNSDAAAEAVTAQSSTNALNLGGTPAAEWATITNSYTTIYFTSTESPGWFALWANPAVSDSTLYRITLGGGATQQIWDAGTLDTSTLHRAGASLPLSAITNAGTMAARATGDFALVTASWPWTAITNPPAVGTGDMTSNVFVTGVGVVATAAVAQAWVDGAAVLSTQSLAVATNGLQTADISTVSNATWLVAATAETVRAWSGLLQSTQALAVATNALQTADISTVSNAVWLVASTAETARATASAAQTTNGLQEARFSGWTNSATLMTKDMGGSNFFGVGFGGTNYWFRLYP